MSKYGFRLTEDERDDFEVFVAKANHSTQSERAQCLSGADPVTVVRRAGR